jgi:branched-chain amino acid transport system ATP-binding protein
METLLEVNHVSADIGQFSILQDVSISVPERSITVLLGRNGAGKTTTLRTIMGYVAAKSGTIKYAGGSLLGRKPYQVGRLGIGYVPEDKNLFPNLTVEENLMVSLRGADMGDRVADILSLFPDLKTAFKRAAGTLSGGQRQMLAIASVVATQPDLLLIDEPSKGLSPLFVDRLGDVLTGLRHTTTVLLVEQNFYLASQVGETYVLMDDGSTVGFGQMTDLVSNTDLQEQILGIRVLGKED